ncbi:MAG: hypothetical protein IOD03_04155 [Methylocystis sp.]|nr:hypothetical protein [Methylocystis sp.]
MFYFLKNMPLCFAPSSKIELPNSGSGEVFSRSPVLFSERIFLRSASADGMLTPRPQTVAGI